MNNHAVQSGGFGGRHAIVIGASTTGLTAAAVVARHFSHVTLLDRDELPAEPVWRKGVPQSRHVHVLLRGGQNVFDHYFPGLTTEMLSKGSEQVDMAGDTAWHHSGGWKMRFKSGVTMMCQTKGFLEWNLRRRVLQLPNVKIRDHAEVREFIRSGDRIGGVRLDDGEELTADVVIDASGRNSRTAQRLADLGFGKVDVTELPVDVGYASRALQPAVSARDWRALLVHPRHPENRCAVLLPIEGGRWLATLVGWRGDHPPADDAGFIEWTRGLATPDFYHAIRNAEPLEPIRQWRFPANLRRHYERLKTMPDGLMVVGDACASINPIYAQGMSQGAIGSSMLDQALLAQRDSAGTGNVAGLSSRFQRSYARFIDSCWLTSTTEDYGVAGAASGRPWFADLANWYLGRVNRLSWHEEAAAQRFIEVMHMLRPPVSLLEPALMVRALLHRAEPRVPSHRTGEV